jgi:regulatory protein
MDQQTFYSLYLLMLQGQLGKEKALQKIRHYCGYQERSHREVKEKLYGFRLRKHEVEEIISQLIEESYLNEERFAIQFAGGKFRLKQWGKMKIRQALKERQVSEWCIRKAMEEIPEDAYRQVLQKLADRKWASLQKEKSRPVRLQKTRLYLMQKGFETGYINHALQVVEETAVNCEL